jgi:hypothetical protein
MNGTATRRSPAPPAQEWKPDFLFEDWTSPGGTPARVGNTRAHDGTTHKAAYIGTDLALVCLGGVTAFWLRFGNPFGASPFAWSESFSQVAARAYPGFLVLYAALIVLACMGQGLYRRAREQSAIGESIEVAKAVFLATALLMLFIFTPATERSRDW